MRGTVQKLVAEILAAWRRAERLAATLPPDSPEREAAQRACDRLRDAYQELTHSGVAAALSGAEAKLLDDDKGKSRLMTRAEFKNRSAVGKMFDEIESTLRRQL
jgi:hypothetical protein